MSAHVNEKLSSPEGPPEDQTEALSGLPARPRGAVQRLGYQVFSRFVAAGPWDALASITDTFD
jgi:hypothetical protein